MVDIARTPDFNEWLSKLCGGDKRTQDRDIMVAKALAALY